MKPTYTKGQKLLFVRRRWDGKDDPGTEVEVTKVGRKYATLSNDLRVPLDSHQVAGGDGYGSPGTVWASREEYEAEVAFEKEWRGFRTDVSAFHNRPANLTLEKLAQIRDLLGVERR